ncbi:hypothetical protein QO058_14710 [Bosea vestrisii]|uniref:hypothetical protein n=1 Tax=Bosea vestrisii TaxID=151416 RepID=UPI0024DF5E6E|nr:hypothetical protein [Bosea vestrisii]WID99367.1 hypothetical protein QO058_14710 [Bosea vestrisii]
MAATDSEGSMKSIEIFLPMNANDGTPFPDTMFDRIENELNETFGGVTAYKRAPAQGRWKSGGQTQGDEIAIFEVVVHRIDRGWWTWFREELENRLGQETILVTARDIEIL